MKVKVTMTIQTSAEGRWGTITHGEAGAAETHRPDTIRMTSVAQPAPATDAAEPLAQLCVSRN